MYEFIQNRIEQYPEQSNDPNQNAISHMSPYLHFGQISAQRIALEVQKADISDEAREAYLEQLIIRRELTDNYCFYNDNYDSIDGFPDWAKKTIAEHKNDEREYVYKLEEFEKAQTHDDLWNAAQKEMVKKGKMHNYMRMYWAKKILEWTESVEDAFKIALYLNDKYELDGRDPNGYVGVAWSVGGVHDRAWQERDIFGKIRYMSYNGCKRKFDVERYIGKYARSDGGENG
jgi:deoxyribodipyrimidine photo-lyase